MHKCPTCEGDGQMKYSVHEKDKEPVTHSMTCIDCNGSGEITDEKKETLEIMKTIWCNCDPHPNSNVTYHPHGNAVCSKHCYTCNYCGKLVQIG